MHAGGILGEVGWEAAGADEDFTVCAGAEGTGGGFRAQGAEGGGRHLCGWVRAGKEGFGGGDWELLGVFGQSGDLTVKSTVKNSVFFYFHSRVLQYLVSFITQFVFIVKYRL